MNWKYFIPGYGVRIAFKNGLFKDRVYFQEAAFWFGWYHGVLTFVIIIVLVNIIV